MHALDFWKLSDTYSIMHAAMIAIGHSPTDIEGLPDHQLERQYPGYIAVRTALMQAVEVEAIYPARLIRFSDDFSGEDGPLDVRRTTIRVAALDGFFRDRGFHCEFFDRSWTQSAEPRSESPFFSKKLDAANRAWAAVTSDPSRLRGRSPKQALENWLIENAHELGLLNKDGKPNRTGIDEICKVANWKPEGGATPTLLTASSSMAPALIRLPPLASPRPLSTPRETFAADLDDDIPF